jgi:cytochrome c-type biogenesis protein
MVSGLSAAELAAAGARAGTGRQVGDDSTVSAVSTGTTSTLTATTTAAAPVVTLRPVVRGIALFIAGFTVVFVALGAVASGIGRLLVSHRQVLTHVSGAVVLVLGVVLLLGAVPATFWSRLGSGPLGVLARVTGERRFDVRPSKLGTWAPPIMGMAFAFAWTPCVSPVLSGVLALAAANGSLAGGILLLFAYSLGLGVPFLATGLAFGRLTAVFARAGRGLSLVEVVGGAILVIFGIVLLTVHIQWLSSEFTNLFDHIGLGRLNTG